jgi:chemotaxis protein MotB
MNMKQKPKKDNSERWLLTYSDLITLLMILFILLFAISNVNQEKYDKLSESLSNSMGKGTGGSEGGIFPEGSSNTPFDLGGTGDQNNQDNQAAAEPTKEPEATAAPDRPEEDRGASEFDGSLKTEQDMIDFESYVDQILIDLSMDVATGTAMMDRGLAITFKNDVFFDSGQDTLKEPMQRGLTQIAKLLNKVDNNIIIEGYTDNVPISPRNKFASNWQLSAARAANVAQYLEEEENVDGERISAVGYGEHHPVASNDTAEGRSQNRRVDIIILYNDDIQE